jgi:hypothetical protein
MAKRDRERLQSIADGIEPRRELKSYTDDVEDSVVKHVEALKRREDEGGSTANLVVDTLTKTLNGLPDNDKIKFIWAIVVLLLGAIGGFVTLRIYGV